MKHDIRQAILNAASSLFSRFGFHKTTMEDIAKGAMKKKSSLYYYFKSKEEVFDAVIEHEAKILRSEIIAAVEKAESPQKKLKQYTITRMMLIKKLVNFYEALKSDYLNNMKFIQKVREKYDKEEMEVISGILKFGVEEDVFVLKDIQLNAFAILTTMKGLEIPLFVSSEQTNFDQLVDDLLHILFYGIIKR